MRSFIRPSPIINLNLPNLYARTQDLDFIRMSIAAEQKHRTVRRGTNKTEQLIYPAAAPHTVTIRLVPRVACADLRILIIPPVKRRDAHIEALGAYYNLKTEIARGIIDKRRRGARKARPCISADRSDAETQNVRKHSGRSDDSSMPSMIRSPSARESNAATA